MKFKDIKNLIRQENESARVPDVLAGAKKTPINRLLTGETPQQAFAKTLIMRLLATLFVLFFAMAIAFTAMWFANHADATSGASYISVVVTRSDGSTENYAMTASGPMINDYIREYRGDSAKSEKLDIYAATQLYELKTGDKVSIYVISTDDDRAKGLSAKLYDEFETAYIEVDGNAEVHCYVGRQATLSGLRAHLVALGVDATSEDGVAELVEKYEAYLNLDVAPTCAKIFA